jgi:hypothetical protein
MRNKYQDYIEPSELAGKTILACTSIPAEFGRTYNGYLLLKFTDGTRQLFDIHSFIACTPEPTVETMKRAPEEDIGRAVEREETRVRRAQQN